MHRHPCTLLIKLLKVIYISPCISIKKKKSEVTQSCLTLCDPMDCSLPGSSVHSIFQTRVLVWVAISFSRRSSRLRDWTQVFHIAHRRFTVWVTREAISPCGIYLPVFPLTIEIFASLVAQRQRIHLPVQETRAWSLGLDDTLEREMATHYSILAWEIHRQRSLAGLHSINNNTETFMSWHLLYRNHSSYHFLSLNNEVLKVKSQYLFNSITLLSVQFSPHSLIICE